MTHAPVHPTYENFAELESARMFAAVAAQAGGSNRWNHNGTPTPIDDQPIIRMNRDTLYSAAIIDVSQGATITIPDAGERYISVMLVNQGHYINRIIHQPGVHELTAEDLGSDFVLAAARILVDPEDPTDVAVVNELQSQFELTSVGGREHVLPEFDQEAFGTVRGAILELSKGMSDLSGAFGRKEDVDPIKHLLGTAMGWGGLPESEAFYLNVSPGLPVGEYELVIGDAPVDGFWSISLYNADGYFEENTLGAYSVNNITGVRNPDGTMTVRFSGSAFEAGSGSGAGSGADAASGGNILPIMDGWNYMVRMYRPRPEVVNGTWKFPTIEAR